MTVRALLVLAIFMHGSAMSQGSSEALSIQPPKIWGNWKQATEQRAPDGTHLTAWVPHDQDTVNWKEAISVFTFPSRPAGDVTTNAIRTIAMQANAACANLNIVKPFHIAAAGVFNFADDESMPVVEWLKKISEYLETSVRVCAGPAEKRDICSR